jgi:hypothetical protein
MSMVRKRAPGQGPATLRKKFKKNSGLDRAHIGDPINVGTAYGRFLGYVKASGDSVSVYCKPAEFSSNSLNIQPSFFYEGKIYRVAMAYEKSPQD